MHTNTFLSQHPHPHSSLIKFDQEWEMNQTSKGVSGLINEYNNQLVGVLLLNLLYFVTAIETSRHFWS